MMARMTDIKIAVERRSMHVTADEGPNSADVFSVDDMSGGEAKLLKVYRVELDLDRGSAVAKVTYIRPGRTGMQTEYIALDAFDLRFSGVLGKTLGLPGGLEPLPNGDRVRVGDRVFVETAQ